MAKVLTTIVLEFGFSLSESEFSCQIELDDSLNVADGEVLSTFYPGQDCYFLTKCSSNVRITNIRPTWGQINTLGNVSRTRETDLLFVELNSVDNRPMLAYAPSGALSSTWIGNIGGRMDYYPDTKELDMIDGTVPCFCKASYPVSFVSYKLSHTALENPDYSITIVVYLEEIR